MAVIPYRPYPTTAPQQPPEVLQRIEATPAMFGGLVGAAEQRGGAQLEQAGNELAGAAIQRQLLYNQVAADQASYGMLDQSQKIVNGVRMKHGQDALDAIDPAKENLQDLYDQTRAQLPNDRARIEFDAQTRRLHSFNLAALDNHYDQEFQRYSIETQAAGETVAMQGIAANYNNPAAVADLTDKAVRAAVRRAQTLYGTDASPDILRAAADDARVKALTSQITAMGVHDPSAADALAEQHREELGAGYPVLKAHLRERVIGARAVNDVWGTGPAGGAAAGPPSDPRGVVPLIRRTAQKYGIDPDVAVRVAQSEGLGTFGGDLVNGKPTSFGAFQLHVAPGAMGADFQRDTGLDPSDPKNEAATIDYALKRAAEGGWSPFHGAARSGIGERQGLAGGTNIVAPLTDVTQSQPPGLAETERRLAATIHDPQELKDALSYAREQYSAEWTDRQRSYELQQRQQKLASEAEEDKIIADAESPNPTITARDISQNKGLTPEAKLRMISYLDRVDKPDPLAKVSQETTVRLLDDIRRPVGDPQRISDMNPIYDAFSKGQLSKADFGFLRDQITNVRSPDGEKLAEVQKDFLAGLKSSITKSNPLLGQLDPSGDPQFYRFQWDINQKINQYKKDEKKEGKNPFDLFNPSKPDYLGSPEVIKQYQVPLQQSTRNIANRLGGGNVPAPATAAPAPTPAIAPRQPGETIDDYVRRVGALPPALLAPAPAR